jgi:hypothetical protein
MISTRIKKRAQNQSLFTGKGYVDGAGDGIQTATKQSPAASATGLLYSQKAPSIFSGTIYSTETEPMHSVQFP